MIVDLMEGPTGKGGESLRTVSIIPMPGCAMNLMLRVRNRSALHWMLCYTALHLSLDTTSLWALDAMRTLEACHALDAMAHATSLPCT